MFHHPTQIVAPLPHPSNAASFLDSEHNELAALGPRIQMPIDLTTADHSPKHANIFNFPQNPPILIQTNEETVDETEMEVDKHSETQHLTPNYSSISYSPPDRQVRAIRKRYYGRISKAIVRKYRHQSPLSKHVAVNLAHYGLRVFLK